ncbi:MAG: HEAT repeat domain-containing protein [Chloroflexi bacterium]|nr:HEAT repeat domain-containing protein [Chloroflexota bacterium]
MTERDPDSFAFDWPADNPGLNKPESNDVLAALSRADAESKRSISPTLVYGLSDLAPKEWQKVHAAWRCLEAASKRRILRMLNESSEALFELNYRELGLNSLDDESAMVREAAIELLWTDESEDTMRQFIRLAAQDPSSSVRTCAIKALGRFILLGEFGDVSEELAKEAQQLALRLHTNSSESLETRRRALESLANSSHPLVPDLISKAYADGNHDLKISAIFAMGRSCSGVWQEILLQELESHDNEAVYEAVSACGHIQLEDSVVRIGELALSNDREIQLTAIWALGEIGGSRAFEILSRLEEVVEDKETASILEEALDTAGFRRSFAALDLRLDEE